MGHGWSSEQATIEEAMLPQLRLGLGWAGWFWWGFRESVGRCAFGFGVGELGLVGLGLAGWGWSVGVCAGGFGVGGFRESVGRCAFGFGVGGLGLVGRGKLAYPAAMMHDSLGLVS